MDTELLDQSTEKSQTKQESGTNQSQSSPSSDTTIVKKQREFSYQELVTATNNFKIDRYLGEGGFGQVYKGNLKNPNQ